jgi:hypothetical protein
MSEQSDQQLINITRITSFERVLKEALEYHFSNFVKLEKLAKPYFGDDDPRDKLEHAQAMTTVKFEAQAYISQFRRLKHFLDYFMRKKVIREPENPELKQTWQDLMQKGGVINMLANKWAVHRSADDPKGETNSLHLEVLLNLDGPVTMWGDDHLYLSIGKYSFYLFYYHSKVLKFIDWVFKMVGKYPYI